LQVNMLIYLMKIEKFAQERRQVFGLKTNSLNQILIKEEEYLCLTFKIAQVEKQSSFMMGLHNWQSFKDKIKLTHLTVQFCYIQKAFWWEMMQVYSLNPHWKWMIENVNLV